MRGCPGLGESRLPWDEWAVEVRFATADAEKVCVLSKADNFNRKVERTMLESEYTSEDRGVEPQPPLTKWKVLFNEAYPGHVQCLRSRDFCQVHQRHYLSFFAIGHTALMYVASSSLTRRPD